MEDPSNDSPNNDKLENDSLDLHQPDNSYMIIRDQNDSLNLHQLCLDKKLLKSSMII